MVWMTLRTSCQWFEYGWQKFTWHFCLYKCFGYLEKYNVRNNNLFPQSCLLQATGCQTSDMASARSSTGIDLWSAYLKILLRPENLFLVFQKDDIAIHKIFCQHQESLRGDVVQGRAARLGKDEGRCDCSQHSLQSAVLIRYWGTYVAFLFIWHALDWYWPSYPMKSDGQCEKQSTVNLANSFSNGDFYEGGWNRGRRDGAGVIRDSWTGEGGYTRWLIWSRTSCCWHEIQCSITGWTGL